MTAGFKAERLTKKLGGRYCASGASQNDPEWSRKAKDKLGRLEDIESELGVGLEALWKAIKEPSTYIYAASKGCRLPDGIYKAVVTGISALCAPNQLILTYLMNKGDDNSPGYIWEGGARINEYGKTWALTKEELEEGE